MASVAIIIVGAAKKSNGYEQNRSSNTSLPLPTTKPLPPTGDEGNKRPIKCHFLPVMFRYLQHTHLSSTLCLTMTYHFHLSLFSLPHSMTRSLTHYMKMMYLIQVSKNKKKKTKKKKHDDMCLHNPVLLISVVLNTHCVDSLLLEMTVDEYDMRLEQLEKKSGTISRPLSTLDPLVQPAQTKHKVNSTGCLQNL